MTKLNEIFRPPVGTGSMELLLASDSANQRFSIFLQTLPEGEGTNTHLHDNYDEAGYVIEGDLTVSLDGQIHRFSKGDSFFVPLGVPHAISNFGSATARFLVITTPGGLESFFREIESQNASGAGDAASVREIAEKHGMRVMGPALDRSVLPQAH